MIRTHILPCRLPVAVAEAFNRESGRIYTQSLVWHYRIYRKQRVWLSRSALEKFGDGLDRDRPSVLQAHSIDAAQQGFPNACKTARESRKRGLDVAYPHRRKPFRTTIWKNTAIRRKGQDLELSTGKGNPKVSIAIPTDLQDVLRFQEVRLVYDKKARRYNWHVVVE